MSDGFSRVIHISEMPASGIYCAAVAGVAVALCRVRDTFFAVSNQCTHAQSTFEAGRLRGYRLICPLHGVMFDLRTGQPAGALTKQPLDVYPLRVTDDGFVEVQVPTSV